MGIAITCCKGQGTYKKNQRLSKISQEIKINLFTGRVIKCKTSSKCRNYIKIHKKSLFKIQEVGASQELSQKGSFIC